MWKKNKKLLITKKKNLSTSGMQCTSAQQAYLRVYFVEFSSNPNHTHLNKLIKVFRITRKLQASDFGQGWR